MNRICLMAAMSAGLLLAQSSQQPPATAPETSVESPFKASSEVGYRFLTGERGSFNTYRSVVNLGEGPRLLSFQAAYAPPSAKWLDEFRIHGANWGDPLNSFQLNAEKSAIYRVNFVYRNLAYFNALPSFASPQLAKLGPDAYTTNQRAFDTRQRFWNVDLDLLPGRRWQPFFGVAYNGGLGYGVSPFVLDENSYPGASRIDYGYRSFRGGLRLELDNLHLSLEQGGATFHDDTSLLGNVRDTGNRQSPLLGRQLFLDRATQLYGVTGEHIYSSADLTVSPVSWLDFSGEFYFSQPKSSVQFNEAAQGSIFLLDRFRFVNGQQSAATGYANQPRTAGGLTLEVRPIGRLRIVNSWQIERTHNSGSLALLTTIDSQPQRPINLNDRLAWRQNENRLQAFFEVSKRLTLFGGHRYLWGESEVRRATLAPGPATEIGLLNRHSALGGLILRPFSKLTINAETEIGRGEQTYFRTSLQNFEQLRLRARYQLSEAWQFNARVTRLKNYNPAPGVDLDFRSQQANMTIQWTRKFVSVMADYTRSTIQSDLHFLDPVTYNFERSFYRDNAHTATLATDLRLPRKSTFTFGGSMFRSAGSRPSRFYQPLLRLRVPFSSSASFLAEWRHVSMGQTFYSYEAFGVQQFTAGLRLGR
jgi:hypothetical protein